MNQAKLALFNTKCKIIFHFFSGPPTLKEKIRMTTFIKTKYNKSDDQTNIDNIE